MLYIVCNISYVNLQLVQNSTAGTNTPWCYRKSKIKTEEKSHRVVMVNALNCCKDLKLFSSSWVDL